MTIEQAFELAFEHHQSGRLAEAEAIYRQILAVEARHVDALHLLGLIALQAGRNDVALDLIRQAIALRPGVPEFHCNLAVAQRRLGCLDESIASCEHAIALHPSYPEAHSNLGIALRGKGKLAEAIAAFRRAIGFKPNFQEAYNALGVALCENTQAADAVAACNTAIALSPGDATAHYNLGNALMLTGRLDESIAAYRQCIALKPEFPEAFNNLAGVLKDIGQLDDAIAAYRHAAALNPSLSQIGSYLLYTLHFHTGYDRQSILGEHRRWNAQYAEPLRPAVPRHSNDRAPERRLRIGYVSPNFSRHVICHFLTPLLQAHDREQFEIYCYSSVARPDRLTEQFRTTADAWRDILGMPDELVAQKIREDQIDILVDLSQHMADNRLLVFARKPAPVQVAWLGYPDSTGLETMDYRITDSHMEPEHSAWSGSVEKPIRLPDSWFCFDPIDQYPEPGRLPALRAGHVTFGSFNNFCKVNHDVLKLWTEVLNKVEGSKLLLQCPAGMTQARVRRFFEAQGIRPNRVDLFSRTQTRMEFLQLFDQVDIGLETFPYNGGTTTCEALWMGVPVPTMRGGSSVSRIGSSILSAVGLPELVGDSAKDYLETVASLAHDLPRLAGLRSSLRSRMKSSPFMDGPRFTRHMEAAFRKMWRTWCRAATASSE